MNSINDFAAECHEQSRKSGFWEDAEWLLAYVPDGPRPASHGLIVSQKLALIHSEVSEALEEDRQHGPWHTYKREDGKPEGLVYELADVVIRCFDLMVWLGFDVYETLIEKADYNAGREKMHGGKRY